MAQEVYRAHFKIEDYRLSKLLFHEGLGAQSLLFILPGIFLALPISIIKRNKASIFSLYLFILPFLMYLVYRYVVPLANVRYLYALLGIGTVYGFVCLQYLKAPPRAVKAGVILCCLSSMAELAKRQELVFSVIMTLICFALLIVFGKKLKIVFLNLKKLSFILPVFLLIAAFLVIGQKQYIKNEFSSYKKMVKYSGFWPDAAVAWEWLNDNTSGNNIAYIGRPVPFPLYGSGFKNNVYYVSVNKVEPAYLHSFPSGRYSWSYDFLSLHNNLEAEGNYRGQAEYQLWLSNLLSRQTDFLFIYSLHQIDGVRFPVEDSWAAMHPGQFSLVFNNETI
ncbi:MAG: hypothetical protein FJZ15_03740, partial [Candidatus Omnitrophica bacterium]|nr:hypothetical protein [Candidatus Omnitrophota bacterium]